MPVDLGRGPGRVAVAWLLALSLICLAACDPGRAVSNPAGTSRATTGSPAAHLRVLQMNLCNSGRAACYTGGRAVSVAAALVQQHRPDMISVNEVCRDDLRLLKQAMSVTRPHAAIGSAFASAQDPNSRSPVLCQNGQDFGDAVLVVVPSSTSNVRNVSGIYPMQDPGDMEDRVWACIELPQLSACTTHTASTSATVALEQCRYLLTSVAPAIGRRTGGAPNILGADLNLPARGSPSALACLPSGYQRADDDGVQNVMASPGTAVRSRTVLDMQGTTDHPGLLVDLALPRQ
ncbi:hypothetical protein [Intrasporangium sp. YIM S08009]|uniref:hypothetical protein n=1 Tax=Intrasporangium zincisolvens TaxID=3080018 RepID=UPI002B05D17D|nr:hypothetical protein [Intrasporangium sp. YIM S08009]